MPNKPVSKQRVAALVGPYLSGKTTLLESLLFAAEIIQRKGSIKEGSTVGDSSPESRARQMSTEMNVASGSYLNDPWTFIDCPGSVELMQEAIAALMVCDVAIVVCEPVPERALTIAPLLKFLDDHKIPHLIFINKMDSAPQGTRVRDVLEALQGVSERPLLLREIPIREGENIVGFVDLASERAWKYRPGERSVLVKMPESVLATETEARREMLERLADFDDHLLEELLEDVAPPSEEVYQNLARDVQEDLVVPVFFGSAAQDHGITRLLKALRHDTPEPEATRARLGIPGDNGVAAQIFKTHYAAHTGKQSFARIWSGEATDGMTLAGQRVNGLFHLMGGQHSKQAKAGVGEVVALGRLEKSITGQVITANGEVKANWPAALPPLFSLAVRSEKKADDVKLSGALQKLVEEDPSISIEHNVETNELVLWGQGEIHLHIAMERLKSKFGLDIITHKPLVPYKETIRKGTSQHARHKRQSGGHGQFADIHVEIKPLPRGAGFVFDDRIVGGVVPKQYIPAVEEGAREFTARGPLGFPVVDVSVTLTDGTFHAVDSSDMAFKMAARLAMSEGLPKCEPVLLEPILHVEMAVPSEHTSKAQRLLSSRRGQILGFDAKPDWKSWDIVAANLPQAEMQDMIVELRSLTMGVGTFGWKFDHLQELSGKPAEKVVEERKKMLEEHR